MAHVSGKRGQPPILLEAWAEGLRRSGSVAIGEFTQAQLLAAGVSQERLVEVIDGGESGLWFLLHEAPVTDSTIYRLEPTTAGAVWERIVELVPPLPGSTVPEGSDG